jgi:hypothetical protein
MPRASIHKAPGETAPFPQNMYFQEAGAASGTGLVQQPVQIARSNLIR